jgi:hypothetical protein
MCWAASSTITVAPCDFACARFPQYRPKHCAKNLRREKWNGPKWQRSLTILTRIVVAALTLEGDLALGDWIAFARGGELLFEQEVTSMQIEHQDIESATKGDAIGMKVNQPVREGVEVYKRLQ